LEKVYENALAFEMRKHGFTVEQQKDVRVFYEGAEVGFYSADLLINQSVLVELKTSVNLTKFTSRSV
jgi:GxxExxY protein